MQRVYFTYVARANLEKKKEREGEETKHLLDRLLLLGRLRRDISRRRRRRPTLLLLLLLLHSLNTAFLQTVMHDQYDSSKSS